MLYLYRCTTSELVRHLQRIEHAGDQVLFPCFVGGRDWVIICRKAAV